MCFLELFTNVEKVDLGTGHHDADQRSVVCAETLQRSTIDSVFIQKYSVHRHKRLIHLLYLASKAVTLSSRPRSYN